MTPAEAIATSVPAPIAMSDVGLRQRRCVVDAVADHGYLSPSCLQLRDFGRLVFGPHPGEDAVDAELGGHGLCDGLGVTGDHHDLNAAPVERGDGFAGLGADLVGQLQRADHLAVATTCRMIAPSGATPALRRPAHRADLLEQSWAADLDLGARHRGCNADGG